MVQTAAKLPPPEVAPEPPRAPTRPHDLGSGQAMVLGPPPRQTTLREHGRRTVVGCREVELERLDIAWRAMAGDKVDTDPRMADAFGHRILAYFALAIRSIGDEDLTALKKVAERVAAVSMLSVADLMYLSFVRLCDIEDGEFVANTERLDCGECNKPLPSKVIVDLHDLVVVVWDTDEPRVVYKVQRPWRLRGMDVETVTLTTPRLNRAMLHLTQSELNYNLRTEQEWLAASVCAINETEMPLKRAELLARDPDTGRSMHDRDWIGLRRAFNIVHGGPLPQAPYTHDCGEEVGVPVHWFRSFFEVTGP